MSSGNSKVMEADRKSIDKCLECLKLGVKSFQWVKKLMQFEL